MYRMGKIFVFLMIILLFSLTGYAGYKLFPYLKTQINNPDSFSQLRQLFKITPHSISSASPSTSPASPMPPPPLYSSSELQVITNFLQNHVGVQSHSGIVFCAFEILSTDSVNHDVIYLWSLCQEYYESDQVLKTGSGISVPVALSSSRKNNTLKIDSYRIPRAGNDYQADLADIFPQELLKTKINNPDSSMLGNLQQQVEIFKNNYFKI
jgi:hypothetical protein